MVLTHEFRENILTHKEYKERLGYKFYIMTEDSVGIVLAKHLYRAKIIEKDGMLYWNLTRTGRSIFITPCGTVKNFYDVLCAITENEKEL